MSYPSSDDFMQKISNLQNLYYSTNTKQSFIKKQQKNECANLVSKLVGTNNMLNHCIYAFDGYKVYIDYAVFKTFVCTDNYNLIVDYFMNVIQTIINEYGRYQLYVNLQTLTISAIERYRSFIMLLSSRCVAEQIEPFIEIFQIHNAPSFLTATSSLLSPFMPDSVKNKLVFVNKNDSNNLPDMISKKIS
jgi:hypothetical protein